MELNKVYNMDCLDFMKTLPDKCIDLILTDPPYGLDISKSNRLSKEKGFTYKEWDINIPDKIYFDEIFRISKNQVICGGNYFIEYLKNTKCFLIWDKLNDKRDFAESEFLWTSFQSVARTFRLRPQNMDNGKVHPTQKPVDLFKWILKNYSKPGEIVFDPFAGSGTAALACLELGNPYILVEKEKDYYDIINKRINIYTDQLQLF